MTTISLSGRFVDQTFISTLSSRARKEMIWRANAGARRAAPGIARAAQSHVAGALKGNKAAKSIRARVWARKMDRFPAVQISSKIPWLGVHQHGGTIRGRMLIQIGRTKGRRGVFLNLVKRLLSNGQAFFRKSPDGRILLFAKPPKGTRGLGAARRIEREARRGAGGRGTIGRNEAFPIGILATKVTIRKRLRVDNVIAGQIPGLCRAMEGVDGAA